MSQGGLQICLDSEALAQYVRSLHAFSLFLSMKVIGDLASTSLWGDEPSVALPGALYVERYDIGQPVKLMLLSGCRAFGGQDLTSRLEGCWVTRIPSLTIHLY